MITLYTSNVYNATLIICQFYLNGAGDTRERREALLV